MIDIPNELFERDIDDIEIGISDIHLFSEDEIEDAQIGYSIDEDDNDIEEWIGEEYLVIGVDSACGDPIIVKTDEEQLPIYSMFHDDWDSLELIADSFRQYLELLEKIEITDLENKDECEEFLENVKEIAPNVSYDYWEALIISGYEFLTGEDF